jgi:battenin
VFVKLLGPFIVHKIKYWQRFIIVVTVNTGCYLTVALTPSDLQWLILIGVCFASISISLGEITFLSLTTLYSKKLSLLGWGSGTGAAGNNLKQNKNNLRLFVLKNLCLQVYLDH